MALRAHDQADGPWRITRLVWDGGSRPTQNLQAALALLLDATPLARAAIGACP
ncbi:MAG: hypothetical protein IPJ77_18230 [Planctomycetes bacterium]|nr:hypothetical protein [Planctomycetota bacterium]